MDTKIETYASTGSNYYVILAKQPTGYKNGTWGNDIYYAATTNKSIDAQTKVIPSTMFVFNRLFLIHGQVTKLGLYNAGKKPYMQQERN